MNKEETEPKILYNIILDTWKFIKNYVEQPSIDWDKCISEYSDLAMSGYNNKDHNAGCQDGYSEAMCQLRIELMRDVFNYLEKRR